MASNSLWAVLAAGKSLQRPAYFAENMLLYTTRERWHLRPVALRVAGTPFTVLPRAGT